MPRFQQKTPFLMFALLVRFTHVPTGSRTPPPTLIISIPISSELNLTNIKPRGALRLPELRVSGLSCLIALSPLSYLIYYLVLRADLKMQRYCRSRDEHDLERFNPSRHDVIRAQYHFLFVSSDCYTTMFLEVTNAYARLVLATDFRRSASTI